MNRRGRGLCNGGHEGVKISILRKARNRPGSKQRLNLWRRRSRRQRHHFRRRTGLENRPRRLCSIHVRQAEVDKVDVDALRTRELKGEFTVFKCPNDHQSWLEAKQHAECFAELVIVVNNRNSYRGRRTHSLQYEL